HFRPAPGLAQLPVEASCRPPGDALRFVLGKIRLHREGRPGQVDCGFEIGPLAQWIVLRVKKPEMLAHFTDGSPTRTMKKTCRRRMSMRTLIQTAHSSELTRQTPRRA